MRQLRNAGTTSQEKSPDKSRSLAGAPTVERCATCGWTLTVLAGHPTATLFHPLRCPCCGGKVWTTNAAGDSESSAA
jgi:hypothetical protein